MGYLTFEDFPDGSPTPELLRAVVQGLSPNNLRRFLYLATAQCSIPGRGLQNPYHNHGFPMSSAPDRITVQCADDVSRLPVGRSCFYRVDLPDYQDAEVLRDKLMTTLGNLEGTGFHLL